MTSSTVTDKNMCAGRKHLEFIWMLKRKKGVKRACDGPMLIHLKQRANVEVTQWMKSTELQYLY